MELTEFMRKLRERSVESFENGICVLMESTEEEDVNFALSLSNERYDDVCSELVRKTASTTTLKIFAKSDHWCIRVSVAENTKTPKEVLMQLAKDDEWQVRKAVAKRSSSVTLVEVLAELAKDKSDGVREAVAENAHTPKEILLKMVEDEDRWVRQGIADNLNAPTEALIKLAKDNDEVIRNIAVHILKYRQKDEEEVTL